MDYSHVLWDFNGTIINDVDVGIKSANTLLSRRNLKLIESLESYRDIFCFPIVDYYKNIGLDLENEKFADLAVEWIELYAGFFKGAAIYEGIIDALEKMKKSGVSQIVLSATKKSMLDGQLEYLGIAKYFDETLGLDNIHAHSKVKIAREWVDLNNPQKAVLIGDTIHDFEVAEQTGVDCILIAAGHQSKERLLQCGVPVYDSVSQMIENLYPKK